MSKTQQLEKLQNEWDQAAERAAVETPRALGLGDTLTEFAGVHIKSGVEAGGLWGTTSCTCGSTCGVPESSDPANCD